ncbi:hypothetical protein HMI55_002480 [Coelomomyces lativittatus]|nr:hypothetical protein HMI56_000741 [Coelomomyces lativittatus]KAJ1516344.1 hypothetical protein HMI55_002480 [Coelomomyces lativittatus]
MKPPLSFYFCCCCSHGSSSSWYVSNLMKRTPRRWSLITSSLLMSTLSTSARWRTVPTFTPKLSSMVVHPTFSFHSQSRPTSLPFTTSKRSLFSFFSNNSFYKQIEVFNPPLKTSLPTSEQVQLEGDIKSKLKQHRHEAVTVDVKATSKFLLEGSTRVVMTAMASNFCLMSIKFASAIATGSASMFAEGVHSMADLLNESLLFFGVMRALRDPDTLHPYGFSRERYAWALVSGVGIFFLGGGVSLYHGITGLASPRMAEDLYLAYLALGSSLAFEGCTGYLALKQVQKAAVESNMSVVEYVQKGADPTAVQIMLEDAAAISGVTIAGICLSLSWWTGNPVFDSAGSIGIGVLLATTAIFLIRRNLTMLVERSMPKHREALVVSTLLTDPVVKSVHDVKSTAIGIDGARFKAEVQFDGHLVTSKYIRDLDLASQLKELKEFQTVDELEVYLLHHGQQVVDQLAEEVDRLEIKIKKSVPEVKHCDLEIL